MINQQLRTDMVYWKKWKAYASDSLLFMIIPLSPLILMTSIYIHNMCYCTAMGNTVLSAWQQITMQWHAEMTWEIELEISGKTIGFL